MTQDEIQAIRAIFDARRIGSAVDDADIDSLEAEVIAALDAARGKAEPVAWMYERGGERSSGYRKRKNYILRQEDGWIETPLYAHPPAPDAARGDPVARVVEWLRKDADQTEIEAGHIVKNSSGNPRKNAAEWAMLVAMKRGLADAIERGEPFHD